MIEGKRTILQAGVPKLAIVVAMTGAGVIGAGNKLPWHIPEDLQLFKRLTAGGTLIMGRRTYESIGRPLPDRRHIVLSRKRLDLPGVETCRSFMAGLVAAAQTDSPVFVIGGAEVYQRALPIAAELHLSLIKGDYPGDRHFPRLNLSEWALQAEKDFADFHYCHYQRVELLRCRAL